MRAYEALGARRCVPIYNALDPTTHIPVPPDARFAADLAFLANRLPDREARVEEFFFDAAAQLPGARFLLGGSGWEDKPMPANVATLGHVYTRDHNAFNCTPLRRAQRQPRQHGRATASRRRRASSKPPAPAPA